MNRNVTHEMLSWKVLPDPPHMAGVQPQGFFVRGFVQARK